MAKDRTLTRPADAVEVEAIARFQHNGVYVTPGTHLLVSAGQAAELHATRFAKKPDVPLYRDRALRGRPS